MCTHAERVSHIGSRTTTLLYYHINIITIESDAGGGVGGLRPVLLWKRLSHVISY